MGKQSFDFWRGLGGLPTLPGDVGPLRAAFQGPFTSTFCQPSGCREKALHDSLRESSSLQCSLFTDRAPQLIGCDAGPPTFSPLSALSSNFASASLTHFPNHKHCSKRSDMIP